MNLRAYSTGLRGASTAGYSLAVGLLVLMLLLTAIAAGCSREVHHGAEPEAGEPRGWVTCRAGSVRLLAINDEALAEPSGESAAIVRSRQGGFTVALEPGRHTLTCRLERRNPHAGRTGEPAYIAVGESQSIEVEVEQDVEVVLEPRLLDEGWTLEIREQRQRDPE